MTSREARWAEGAVRRLLLYVAALLRDEAEELQADAKLLTAEARLMLEVSDALRGK